MTELAALNIRITGDSGDLTAAVNSAKTQLGGLNTTITQTQAKAAGMGGALGGLATRMQGARGQIQNVAFQLQDMAVQLQSGTSASVVFAQQGSQIASAFGPVGAVVGALAAVGIPLLAFAFGSAAAEADKLSAAAEYQKGVLDNLRQATYALRLERQMLQSGTILTEEQEALNEIVRLGYERVGLEQDLQAEMAKANDAMGVINQTAVDAIRLRLEENAAAKAQAQSLLENARLERARIEAINLAKAAQDKVLIVMRQLANSNISGPWETVLGSIQAAIEKAGEYARTAGFGMTTGNANFAKGKMGFTLPGAELLPPEPPAAPGTVGGGGASAANQLQTELQTLQESLMTQEQLQVESYTRQQETLKAALDQRLLSQQEYAALMEQVEKTHQLSMGKETNAGVQATLGHLGQLFSGSKKIGAAIALANSWLAFTEVLKDPAYTGRPFARFAAAGAALSSGLNAVRNIKSASPGGSAGGGGGAGAAGAVGGAAPQQNVQTLNFTLTNDSFGIGQNLIRQIAAQLNESTRNGTTLIRATVS